MQKYLIILSLLVGCALSLKAHATPKVKEVEVNTAARSVLLEDHYLPIIAINISFKHTGYAYDPEKKQGLAQMAVGMLDEGAGNFSATDYRAFLEERAISIRTNVDADKIEISVLTLHDHVEDALKMLALALNQPQLKTDSIERVRAQLLSAQKREKENIEAVAEETLIKTVWGTHPYARASLGESEAVAKISKEEIAQFYQDHFAQDNLEISVAGDLSEKEWKALAEKHLNALPKTSVAMEEISAPVWKPQTAPIFKSFPAPQSVILFALPAPTRKEPEFYTAFVLNHIVGGEGLESRLMESIRKQKGLTYNASTTINFHQKGALWIGYIATDARTSSRVIELIKEQMELLYKKSVTEEELADAKAYLIGSFPLRMTKNSQLAKLIHAIAEQEMPIDFLERRNEWIEAVNQTSITHFISTLPKPSAMAMVVVGEKAP